MTASKDGRAGRPGRGVPAALPVHLATAAFIASVAVGVWTAAEPGSANAAFTVMLAAGAGYLAVWAAARFARAGDALMALLVAAGVGAAGYFLAQYQYLSLEAKVMWLDRLARALSRPFPPLEIWAPFPNSLATLLDGIAGVALGLALGRGRAPARILSAIAFAILVVGLLASGSRGSWLALAAAAAAGTWIGRQWPVPRFWAIAPVVVAAGLAVIGGVVWDGPPWWARLAALAGRPDRLEVYVHAATLLRDAPFTGIGAGDQFAPHLSNYALLIQVPYLTYAHNLTFELWLEHGLPGLAAWWALATATVVAARAGERAGAGWRTRGLWIGLLAIQLHGLSDARQSIDAWTWAPFFILTALLAARLGQRDVRVSRAAAAAPLVVGVLVMVVVTVARGRPDAGWLANRGAVAQARADIASLESAAADAWSAEAASALAAALAADPDDVPARRRLGMLHLGAGRYAEARAELRIAERLDPFTLSTRKAAGLAAVWTGEVDEAARLLGGVPGIVSELNTWAEYRRSRDETVLAVNAAKVSLALDPGQPAVRERLEQWTTAAPAAQR